MSIRTEEVADGIVVLVLPEASMNAMLVADRGEVLVVEAGAGPDRGAELRAIAETRGRVVGVVLTHPHWDHAFGLGAFDGVPSHAHPEAIADLRDTGHVQRDALVAELGQRAPAWLSSFEPPVPSHPVAERTVLRVGALDVVLDPVGHAHAAGDLVVHVPARGVSVLGDLIEVGAPPQLHDADLAGWVAALHRIDDDLQPLVVPGHGPATTPEVVRAQRGLLAAGLAHLRGGGDAPAGLDLAQLPR